MGEKKGEIGGGGFHRCAAGSSAGKQRRFHADNPRSSAVVKCIWSPDTGRGRGWSSGAHVARNITAATTSQGGIEKTENQISLDGFICPFMVTDPTDLGATFVVAPGLMRDNFLPIPDAEFLPLILIQ